VHHKPPNAYVIVEVADTIRLDSETVGSIKSVGNLNQQGIGLMGDVWIKPDWYGNLKLSLYNHNKSHSYKLYKGQPVCQLVLFNYLFMPL